MQVQDFSISSVEDLVSDFDLGGLFAEADAVGSQYQTEEERAAFKAKMAALLSEMNLG